MLIHSVSDFRVVTNQSSFQYHDKFLFQNFNSGVSFKPQMMANEPLVERDFFQSQTIGTAAAFGLQA